MPDCFTIEDLRRWNRSEPSLGVVGYPIKHSASPGMQNAALREFSQFASWEYFRFEITPEDIPEALALFSRANFVGLNFTLPHKLIVYDLLKDLDESASLARAVNTIHFAQPGSGQMPRGYSTDGIGLLTALREAFDFQPKGTSVLLLGAGGAGQTAAITLEREGAEVLWYNRTPAKVGALIPQLGLENSYLVNLEMICWEDVDLIINATSVGLKADEPSPLAFAQFPDARKIPYAYDMVYGKEATPFIREAAASGLKTADGLGMLLHQGARAFEIWTGAPAPVETMRQALRRTLYG